MNNYWEERYKSGGNSGVGSYGDYAMHKADVINKCIIDYNIETVSDFGCGDGNQLSLLSGFSKYCGFDVSSSIINDCKIIHKQDSVSFYDNIDVMPMADLCLSLDVIYHVMEENDFKEHIYQLFKKSKKCVLIFSSNHNENNHNATHIHHRKFTDWIEENQKEFNLIEEIDNFLQTSAKFFLYKKK